MDGLDIRMNSAETMKEAKTKIWGNNQHNVIKSMHKMRNWGRRDDDEIVKSEIINFRNLDKMFNAFN